MMLDGEAIVIKNDPPPRALRISFGTVGLIFLAIGLFGLVNMARYYLAPSSAPDADANPALGIALVTLFLIFGCLGTYVAALPQKMVRLDPHTRQAHLIVTYPLFSRRREFDLAALTPPSVDFTPETGDNAARHSLVMRLPDRTRFDYCQVTLPLDGQRDFASLWCGRITEMIEGADRPERRTGTIES